MDKQEEKPTFTYYYLYFNSLNKYHNELGECYITSLLGQNICHHKQICFTYVPQPHRWKHLWIIFLEK